MNAYAKAYYITFTITLLSLMALPASSQSIPTSTALGSTYDFSYFLSEPPAATRIAGMIANWSSKVGYTAQNWYGPNTDSSHIFTAANGCSYPDSISFYTGHAGFDGSPQHWYICDNNGNEVYDQAIFPNSANQNLQFVMLWACEQADTRGGTYGDGSPYGMPYAWLHTYAESDNGYKYPDSGNLAFAGWIGTAPELSRNLTFENLEEGYNFVKNFYFAALLQGNYLSINRALDFAAFALWGLGEGGSFGVCPFTNGAYYYGWVGNLTIYGDGNLHLSNYETLPVCGMKTQTDGFFYIPKVVTTGSSRLKIEEVFSQRNLTGDQTDTGNSPYQTIQHYPDGYVNGEDGSFIARKFGSYEGETSPIAWDYMADVVPDGTIGGDDLIVIARYFGCNGTYQNFTGSSGITVSFDGDSFIQFYPDPEGFVQIPAGAANFTVWQNYQNNITIGAMITFWSP
jgi:hypothetical protein